METSLRHMKLVAHALQSYDTIHLTTPESKRINLLITHGWMFLQGRMEISIIKWMFLLILGLFSNIYTCIALLVLRKEFREAASFLIYSFGSSFPIFLCNVCSYPFYAWLLFMDVGLSRSKLYHFNLFFPCGFVILTYFIGDNWCLMYCFYHKIWKCLLSGGAFSNHCFFLIYR